MQRPTSTETLLVRAAVGLVAAHTVVDTLIAPARGTTAGDHLAAALVPLGVLLAIVLAYGRLPAWARALVVAWLGALAVVGSGLALADARATFDRPSDWTGFLLAPAGLALLGLGVRLVRRARRPGRRVYLRRAGWVVVALAALYWLVVPVAIALVATHRPRAEAVPIPAGYEPASLTTADGLRLAAWYAPSRNGAAVISFPTRSGKLPQAAMLRRHGYGVLLLDMRGYDGSDGGVNAFGWAATRDLDAAVAWLGRRPDVRDGRIGGIGFSVGGEQMLEAAAENHGLRAVVADGAGERSVRELWLRGAAAALALPEGLVQTISLSVLSDTLPPPSLERVAARIAPGAVLFVYAGRGAGGEDLAPTYYAAAREPKAVWRIPEAGHTGGYAARPREYERRVIAFFDRYLAGAAR